MTSPPRVSPPAAGRLALPALLAASLLLNLLGIWWGLPSTWSWAFDEIHPQHVTAPGSWPGKYPPFHRYLLRLVYGPAEALGADHTFLFLLGRAVSALLATAIVFLIYRLARRWLGRGAALLAAAATAFSPTFVYYAKTMNLEVPYLFWFVLSMLFFVRALEEGKTRDFVLFALTAVFSFSTKDQAAAFYPLTPFLLAAGLAARRPPGRNRVLGYLAALFDRRMLLAGAAGLAAFLLIWKVPLGAAELRAHLAVMASPDWEAIRRFPLTPGGQARMGLLTVRNLGFILGAPFFAAALVGVALAARRFGEHRRLFALLLFILPYYALPLVRTGYSYDRHLLCLAFILSIFAALALALLLESRRLPRVVRVGALTLVLGYSLLRGLWLDLMMVTDARYRAESWIAAGVGDKLLLGLGDRTMLPRNVVAVDWRIFRPRVVGEGDLPPGAYHDCWMLANLDADYLVPDRPAVFDSPGINYEVDRAFRSPLPFQLLSFREVASNLDKVLTEVVVYRRTEAECRDLGLVPRGLADLAGHPDPAGREHLAAAIADNPASGALPLHEGWSVVAGLAPDYFTRGTAPAGIVVTNPRRRPLELELLVASRAPPDLHPIALFLDDGETTRRHTFEAPGTAWIALSEVPPGGRRLFILWTDTEWRPSWETPPLVRGLKLFPLSRADLEQRRRDLALAAAAETLAALRERRDPEARRRLLASAAAGDLPLSRLQGRRVSAFGLTEDGWTRGRTPAGVVVRNRGDRPFRATLKIACNVPETLLPARVLLEDGQSTRGFECRPPGRLRLGLPSVPPGSERLFILWTDAEWSPGGKDPRTLGVRLVTPATASRR